MPSDLNFEYSNHINFTTFSAVINYQERDSLKKISKCYDVSSLYVCFIK